MVGSEVVGSEVGGVSGRRRRGRLLAPGALVALLATVVATAVALGPRPTLDPRWVEPELPADLDAYLERSEAGVPGLRRGDEREIVWADPESRERTSVALVYLHGFSADRHEMEPVVSDVARTLGANVYFARLTGHGRDGAAMAEATAEDWLRDTAEAVAIAERIGDRVVLVGTSTGGTLAMWAAARPEAADRIEAVVLVSPNFQPADRLSRVLLYPWGGWLARVVVGAERCFEPENEAQERHWTTCYPTAALLPMMGLVEHVRTMPLGRVEAAVLLVHSPDDAVVDAAETERVLARLPRGILRTHVVEATSDPSRHVLAGDILSPVTNGEVHGVVTSFIEAVVGGVGPEPGG